MRFLAVLAVIAGSTVAVAQSAKELKVKYGDPEHGVYKVSPDARLRVSYGTDQQACGIALEPADYEKGFAASLADRVLNDIAPATARSGIPRSMMSFVGCAQDLTSEYTNVKFTRSTNECKRTAQRLVIEWIRSACHNAPR